MTYAGWTPTISGIAIPKLGVAVAAPVSAAKESVDQLAQEVIGGKWGNGDDRRKRLTAAGYDYAAVQAAVNRKLA
jgi:hypothetical protein